MKVVGGKYVGGHLLGVRGSKVEFIQERTSELKFLIHSLGVSLKKNGVT